MNEVTQAQRSVRLSYQESLERKKNVQRTFLANKTACGMANGNIANYQGQVTTPFGSYTTTISEIIQENNYYPFGLKHNGYNQWPQESTQNNQYKYHYQGQELQDELGLNWHSFKWRNYDAAIGRFFNIDPLAEKYVNISSYAYTANNPISFIDIDGRDIIFVTNNGNVRLSADLIRKTEVGRALWDKYANSSSVDVYITLQSLEGNVLGRTNELTSQVGNNGLVSGNFHESFNGIDASKSADQGKRIFGIALDKDVFQDGEKWSVLELGEKTSYIKGDYDAWNLAEILFHELGAHIETKLNREARGEGVNGEAEHDEFGGKKLGEYDWFSPDKIGVKFILELEKLMHNSSKPALHNFEVPVFPKRIDLCHRCYEPGNSPLNPKPINK